MPRIIEAYVMSRLESVTTVLQNGTAEDPLDNEEQLQDQLDSLPYLCRFQYDKMSKYICSLMDPIIAMYTEWRNMPHDRDPAPLAVRPVLPAPIPLLESGGGTCGWWF